MHERYEAFCLADPIFYDSPRSGVRGEHRDYPIAARATPSGWRRSELDDWLGYTPREARVLTQGWKIHASACLENAGEMLVAIWDYCVPRKIPFKFVRSEQLFLLRNVKSADRGSSGKLVAIYPGGEHQLELVLAELGARLDGWPGPYILSDLRWGSGPLFVRYGGFASAYCLGANGERELAIEDANGELVPDRRGPTFEVPPWVSLPRCLVPHLQARSDTSIAELPYRIEGALQFSNGGGVYAAVDRGTDERVVLKEARPHAGLSFDGEDAILRLRRERRMLERLAGLDCVPSLRRYLTVVDHEFLVESFVEGSRLSSELVERYPLVTREIPPTVAADYARWAVGICERVTRAVTAVHDRGVVIGDINPSNVLLRPDGEVALVDWEVASLVGEERSPALAAAGFNSPSGTKGFDIDRYALACLRLFMFLPLTALIALDPGKAAQLAAEIVDLFPVPRRFIDEALIEIEARRSQPARAKRAWATLDPSPEGWLKARDSMAAAILASATPDRDDRLFPGDVEQFASGGGVNIAHGAAGVLLALDAVGARREPEHDDWLLRQVANPHPDLPLGFYDGLHGVAYVLDRLGHRDEAMDLLEICIERLDTGSTQLGLGLRGGLAGIALNLAYFARLTDDPSLWDAAAEIATRVADRLGEEDSVAQISGGAHPFAGLLRGSSGPALMFIRLYEQTGDVGLLDLAGTALRQDLRRCVRTARGLEVNEGWRTMPYLSDGGVGLGMVLEDYLDHRNDDAFAQAVDAIRGTAEAQFYAQSGLFYGRAGMIAYLSRHLDPGLGGVDPLVAAQLRRLSWHAISHCGNLAFPGDQLLRLSMDLASGTAGVMLAVGAALHVYPVGLPFLSTPGAERAATADDRKLSHEWR